MPRDCGGNYARRLSVEAMPYPGELVRECPSRVKLRRSQYEQMFSAVPPIADIPWSGPLKAHVVRETVTLARRRKIRTLSKLQRKLLRSPFGFQNCTKMTKYEALEKKVVSNRKLPSLRQSLVRSVTQKVSVCWGFWGWSTVIDSRLPRSMAERVGFEPTVRFPAHTLSKRAP